MSPLPPLLLLLGVVSVAVIATVLGAPLLLCGSQHSGISASSASRGRMWTSRISELIFWTSNVIIRKDKSWQLVKTQIKCFGKYKHFGSDLNSTSNYRKMVKSDDGKLNVCLVRGFVTFFLDTRPPCALRWKINNTLFFTTRSAHCLISHLLSAVRVLIKLRGQHVQRWNHKNRRTAFWWFVKAEHKQAALKTQALLLMSDAYTISVEEMRLKTLLRHYCAIV